MSQSLRLNPQQKEAVKHSGGPLLILAGAGSGKTRVITERIAHLIKNGVLPHSILGVTFTNKAANEMRERIRQRVGGPAREIILSTFHSFGLRLLRQQIHHLGYRNNFTIYNEGDQLSLVRTLIREHPKKHDKFDAGILLSRISHYKNMLVDGKQDPPLYDDKYDTIFDEMFRNYQQSLRASQAVDFDDLILLPVWLFRKKKDLLCEYQQHYQHILVDEYQDTNHGQYVFITQLASGHRNLCVVGDDDQSIYGWRGAEVQNILNFTQDYPDAKVIRLEQNYRSTQTILDAANHLIVNNYKRQSKKLWTDRGRGKNIDAFLAKDENDEAKTIAWRLQTIKERTQARWDQFAVLYRSNIQSRALESVFRIGKIPYTVVGGYEFFERKEVKDIVAYLKVIQNPHNDISLLRIINTPRRGVGNQTVEQLIEESNTAGEPIYQVLQSKRDNAQLSKTMRSGINSLCDLIDTLHEKTKTTEPKTLVQWAIERSGYREEIERTIDDPIAAQMKIESVEELVSAAAGFETDHPQGGLADFIDSISLGDEPGSGQKKRRIENSVMLATLHSAKGLEFPYVFICGMEEDLLPHARSLKDNTQVDEERRLFYVGITRAQTHLTLSLTQERTKFGKKTRRTPSRFIAEVPPSLLCKQYSHSLNFFDKQKRSGETSREEAKSA